MKVIDKKLFEVFHLTQPFQCIFSIKYCVSIKFSFEQTITGCIQFDGVLIQQVLISDISSKM